MQDLIICERRKANLCNSVPQHFEMDFYTKCTYKHSRIFERLWGLRVQCVNGMKMRTHQSYRALNWVISRARSAEFRRVQYRVVHLLDAIRVELYKKISKIFFCDFLDSIFQLRTIVYLLQLSNFYQTLLWMHLIAINCNSKINITRWRFAKETLLLLLYRDA